MPHVSGTPAWNKGMGSGWTDRRGYRWIYVEEFGKRRAKREHRHIMEQHLGRQLSPEELVHHRNGDRSDNRIDNLELVPWGEHTARHNSGVRHSEYSKHAQSVLAGYREDNKRLKQINAELLETLKGLAADVEKIARDSFSTVGGDFEFDYRYEDPDGYAVWSAARAAIRKATSGAQ